MTDRASSRSLSEPERLLALDGVRGVAVLAVIASHLVEKPARVDSVGSAVALALDSGWWGVDLFFVLSGFLITGILLEGRGVPGAMRSFFGRRALRIWPMSLVTMALAFVVLPAAFPRTISAPPAGVVVTYLLFAGNLWIAFVGWPPVGGFLWSIFVEEQFYFAWPWVVRRAAIDRLAWVCLAVALGSALLRIGVVAWSPVAAYVLAFTRLDGLALGAWLAVRRHQGADLHAFSRAAIGAGALGVGVLAITRGGWDLLDPVTVGPGVLAVTVLFAGGVARVVADPEGRLAQVLEGTVLRWFGRHSYALYLLHRPIMIALDNAPLTDLRAALGPAGWGALCVGLSCGAAWASWHLVEKRFLALKRLFPRGSTASAAGAA